MVKNNQLWTNIQNFKMDDPQSKLTFTKRLARENGWTPQYASRVVEEYKKFIYLSVTSRKSLTPSDEVDQAWHLHLIYSQSYWIDFVRNTLQGYVIHHGPTKGGSAEGERFTLQYDDTLTLYRESFGPQPIDIWPNSKDRFSKINYRRVDVDSNIIINKDSLFEYAKSYTIVGLLILAGLLTSATVDKKKPDDGISWFWIFVIAVIIIFLVRGIYRLYQQDKKSSGSSGSGGDYGDGIAGAFFGCGTSSCGSSHSGCGSSGCGSSCGGGCGGCGGCGG